jgi:TonB family protein
MPVDNRTGQTMSHDVFVSHASKDKAIADAVCAVLEREGIRCWIAPRDILPGADWGRSLIQGIKGSRAMVLVLSRAANTSPHILREVERAVHLGLPILPLRIEQVLPEGALEFHLGTVHWLDAVTPPLEAHLTRLAETLTAVLQQDGGDGSVRSPEAPRVRATLGEAAEAAPGDRQVASTVSEGFSGKGRDRFEGGPASAIPRAEQVSPPPNHSEETTRRAAPVQSRSRTTTASSSRWDWRSIAGVAFLIVIVGFVQSRMERRSDSAADDVRASQEQAAAADSTAVGPPSHLLQQQKLSGGSASEAPPTADDGQKLPPPESESKSILAGGSLRTSDGAADDVDGKTVIPGLADALARRAIEDTLKLAFRPAEPVRVGGDIRPPEKIRDVSPLYPPMAQSARVEGVVVIEAVIGLTGRVRDAKVLRSIPLLDQAALDAVRLWEFTPTLVNGAPVPVIMTFAVRFSLE